MEGNRKTKTKKIELDREDRVLEQPMQEAKRTY